MEENLTVETSIYFLFVGVQYLYVTLDGYYYNGYNVLLYWLGN
jgi:hypothetical protein